MNNAVRLNAAEEFTVYMINRSSATSDASLGLPIDTLNTEYLVMTYAVGSGHNVSLFNVTAAYDNTTVTITPKLNIEGGGAAATPFTVVLNRGEGILQREIYAGASSGLVGSTVSSDKPVVVNNGNLCANVPPNVTACDHIFEVAIPVQAWGKEVPVVNLPNRPSGTIYRVIAAEDNTSVTLDGVGAGVINRGGFLELGPIPADHVIAADKAIFVAQFMTGLDSPGATQGDPAMGNMIPTAQYLDHYTFATVGGGQFASHFLTIIAKTNDVGTLTLDGVAVTPESFTAIPGTEYSESVMNISEGTHRTASRSGHGIAVSGFGSYDSYLFTGGAQFAAINPTGDENPPVCALKLTDTTPPSLTGTATDDRASEDTNGNKTLDAGEDLNNNGKIDKDSGIFSVKLSDEAANVSLAVATFVPGQSLVGFDVSLVDANQPGTGEVVVEDGSGNTCRATIDFNRQQECTVLNVSRALTALTSITNQQRAACMGLIDLKSKKSTKWSRAAKKTVDTLHRREQQAVKAVSATALQCEESISCSTVATNTAQLRAMQTNGSRLHDFCYGITRDISASQKKERGGACSGSINECRARLIARKVALAKYRDKLRSTRTKLSTVAKQIPRTSSVCDQ